MYSRKIITQRHYHNNLTYRDYLMKANDRLIENQGNFNRVVEAANLLQMVLYDPNLPAESQKFHTKIVEDARKLAQNR